MKVKNIIPRFIKEYIKKQVNKNNLAPAEYIIKTKDINSLYGKRVIVTGGTGAIGSAICHRLLIEGAVVGICARNEKKLEDLLERFSKENIPGMGKAIPIILDVNNDEAINHAIKKFVNENGRVDIFINNAGGGAREESKLLHEQDISIIDDVLNTNLRASIMCARIAAKFMVSQNYGKIINMSSVIALGGMSKMSDYAAAKAGIIGFTKSLAIELGKYNITVNCISPGMVNQIAFDAGFSKRETNTNCLRRFGYTDEVANLVSFIISDKADYITGHNFVIDGGRSLGLMGS